MRDGLTLPLVVKNIDGDILFALLINEKGYRKSIENSELWVINADTDRLLPYEGEGKYEGKAGGILVDYNGVTVRVGSGFDDIQRKNWKKLFPKGTIITIKYWEIDKHSKRPRFPIFLRIREKE